MSSARDKAKHLIKLALDRGAEAPEGVNAAFKALTLIAENDLLSAPAVGGMGGAAATVAGVVERATNPDFVEGVVNRAEKFAAGFDRIVGVVKKVAGDRKPAPEERRRRRRR